MKSQLSKPSRSKARYTDQYERFLKKNKDSPHLLKITLAARPGRKKRLL